MPRANIGDVQLPRSQSSRAYTGLGCWNSRGANLVTSLRAMLGDNFAYVETPEFTLRRLKLRYAGDVVKYHAALDRALYKSTGAPDWGGLRSFSSSSGQQVDVAEELRSLKSALPSELKPQLERLAALASSDDDAASLLARILMDRHSRLATATARRTTVGNLVSNRNKWQEQPEDFVRHPHSNSRGATSALAHCKCGWPRCSHHARNFGSRRRRS